MEQNAQVRRASRTAEEWSQIVEEWRSSGLSARAFSEKRGVGESSLYQHWAQRSRGQADAVRSVSEPRFLSVAVANEPLGAPGGVRENGRVEIVWPRGPVVRVVGDASAQTLAVVLRAIAEVVPC